jgi:NAD(P)-dependent dehydrogenase (short-subunit alcohol dehydrogenase family)
VKRLLVVGGSSRIAREFAVLGIRGGWAVTLAGRNLGEMQICARDLQIRAGAEAVGAVELDLEAPVGGDALERVFSGSSDCCGLFVAAGLMPAEARMARDPVVFRQAAATNYLGPASLVEQFLPHAAKRDGSFASCLTSVAGDRGRPGNFRYGSTKAALSTYLQGLRCASPPGILIQDIKLGPVDTPMNSGNTRAPMMILPREAARQIWSGISRKQSKIYVPRRWRLIMAVIRVLPDAAVRALRL